MARNTSKTPKRLTGPVVKHNLRLDAPIDRWDEAAPIGNGLLGALLWGGGRDLKVSLDRGDLWDRRVPESLHRDDWTYAELRRLVAEGDHAEMVRRFDAPYRDSPYPTKLPVGRLKLRLDAGCAIERFEVDLRDAVTRVTFDGGSVTALMCATRPVGMIRILGSGAKLEHQPPPFGQPPPGDDEVGLPLSMLQYPAPRLGRAGNVRWAQQTCGLGFGYAVVSETLTDDGGVDIAFAITTNDEQDDCVALGRQLVDEALCDGFDALFDEHRAWWGDFWSRSAIAIPHEPIEQHYYVANYFLGSASRRGAPPMPIQGVWTADNGRMPPWKGDYHHDLNTQFSYCSYQAAGRFEEGRSFLDFMTDLLPAFKRFYKRFHQLPGAGAAIPGNMSIDGGPLGGWNMNSLSPTNSAWVAQHYYLHWRYTMDEDFLVDEAYPFCESVATFLEHLLEPDERGKLMLPLSASPEVHDNRLEAYMTPNTNYDLSLMRWLFAAMVELAAHLGIESDVERFGALLNQLDDLAVEQNPVERVHLADHRPNIGGLKLSPDESLVESHRHLSHLMPIWPLGTLHVEGSQRDRDVINQSLSLLDLIGPGKWVGFSYTWMACMGARARLGDRALFHLEAFVRGLISRNGFCLNGDYKNIGLTSLKYRPFTLETNLHAAQAVHEMLLQSWGGRVRLFPAMPESWREAAFDDLRAEGAWRISARRQDGRTTWLRIKAESAGELRLADPFDGRKATFKGRRPHKAHGDYVCAMRKGDVVEACAK
jgi:alpha-L-fucosidase 2